MRDEKEGRKKQAKVRQTHNAKHLRDHCIKKCATEDSTVSIRSHQCSTKVLVVYIHFPETCN